MHRQCLQQDRVKSPNAEGMPAHSVESGTGSHSGGHCDMSRTAGPQADHLTCSVQCMFCDRTAGHGPSPLPHPMPGMEQPPVLQSAFHPFHVNL